MKKLLIFFLSCLFISQFLFGQNPLVKQWDRVIGGTSQDEFSTIAETADQGFIVGGSSTSGIGGDKTQGIQGTFDYWVVKTDSVGNIIWDKDFGGTLFDFLTCVKQTFDGGYILGGWTPSGVGGDKTQPIWGGSDFWVVKIDSLGNKQWDEDFGGTNTERLFSLLQTSDSGYIFGGYSFSGISGNKTQASQGLSDFWIVKTNSLGIKQWDRRYGGNQFEELHSMNQTSDGGYILCGLSSSGISGDKTETCWGNTDYWILKIDGLGNKQWDKRFGGLGYDWPSWIMQTNDKGYIVGGRSDSNISGNKSDSCQGDVDFWIVKMDSVGTKSWDRTFGGAGNEEYLGSIIQTCDNGYLITGKSFSDSSGSKTENNLGPGQSWLIKTDSLGNKIWDKTIQSLGSEYSSFAIQSKDGCYIIASENNGAIGGEKSQNSWNSSSDYWMIKFCDTTSVCVLQVFANLLSSDTTFCDKQYIDFFDHSTNNPTSWQWLFPGGTPSTSTQQNPTGIFYNSFGSFDVTLIACNASGCDTLYLPNFINELPNPPVPTITWIADTLFSSPAFSYQWYDTSGIIPGATGQYYVFQQTGNYYVVVTDSNGCASSSFLIYTGIDEVAGGLGGISIVPNPSNGNLILYGVPILSTLKIYDVAGRIIYSDRIESAPEQLKLKAQDGVYFLEIISGNKFTRKKIVIKN